MSRVSQAKKELNKINAQEKKLSIITLVVIFIAMILSMIIYMYASNNEIDYMPKVMQYESELFGEDIFSVNIIADDTTWQSILDNAMLEEYTPVDVEVNGVLYKNVGFRPKGNSTLMRIAQDSSTDRFSFKIKFDEYVTGQTCMGLDLLILNNIMNDNTYMKDYVAYDIFNYIETDSLLYNFVNMSLNDENIGLYFGLEGYSNSFLARTYGHSNGYLYKVNSSSMEVGGNNNIASNDSNNISNIDSKTASNSSNNNNIVMSNIPDTELVLLNNMQQQGNDRGQQGQVPQGVNAEETVTETTTQANNRNNNNVQQQDEMPQMGQMQGEMSQMGQIQGEMPQGDMPQMGQMQGEMSQGEIPQMGQMQGEMSQGEMPQMGQMQGEMSQMGQIQGEMSQGEIPQMGQMQGEMSQGDMPQKGQIQGEMPQGDMPQKGQMQGEMPQGEIPQIGQMQGENTSSNRQQGGGGGMMNMTSGSGGGGDFIYSDDNIESYTDILENSINNTAGYSDKMRVIEAIKVLNEATTTEDIEAYWDVDNILRFFAGHTTVVNMDSFSAGRFTNLYVYEFNGKMNLIPWDYNESFAGAFATGVDLVNFPIDTPFINIDMSEFPLFDKLLAIPEYKDLYYSYLVNICNYIDSTLINELSDLQEKINPLVESDPTAFITYSTYITAVEEFKSALSLRSESIRGQVAGTIPSTTQEQAQNSQLLISHNINTSTLGSNSAGGGGGGNGDRAQNMGGGMPNNMQMPDFNELGIDLEGLGLENIQSIEDLANLPQETISQLQSAVVGQMQGGNMSGGNRSQNMGGGMSNNMQVQGANNNMFTGISIENIIIIIGNLLMMTLAGLVIKKNII